ncbi:MAG: coagulation factor 5/8 type domain-containing protein, partial [Lysobacterales bacterium RIFOXYD1_FULL_69_11]
TPNDFIRSVAADAPRGHYPRGFTGEQPYWTLVGIDGGTEQGLVGEDGAVELARGGPSVEPFVLVDGELVTWADVGTRQTLQEGYLPIPLVHWAHPAFTLDVTAFAQGTTDTSRLVTRYRLENTGDVARDFELVLMLRPLQVNPPTQFLSTVGGVSPIHALEVGTLEAKLAGVPRVRMATPADAAFVSAFDSGLPLDRLDAPDSALDSDVDDSTGLASGAWRYRMRLAPGEVREFAWQAPLTGTFDDAPLDAGEAQVAVAADWHDRLDRVRIDVPDAGRKLVDTLRTALAHMLISREGPRLQPGTRSYSRAWIRDGAMIAEGLLRLGREDVAEEFLRWYAPYQFDNGKVPCCVDDRGSDPVPENDSHGELVYTVAEIYRYTRDRELLEDMWPHVVGAVSYMDELRLSERTEANRALNAAFYGMMPASISHEGYSAKPMHSYWDNFWTLRGYKDAVLVAQWLGRDADAKRFAASRDQFRGDLMASLRAATAQHDINYLPGAAELGDFDPTSTTIALAPGGEQAWLPQDLLDHTFQRYWREFVARREGTREWKDYTPYELRNVGAFVRLGWRDRAHEALDFFFDDQQPRGWNQWAEVVSRTPRTPFFVGDLPHAWVESDYVRSALEMFAYVRDGEDGAQDDALVLAAGVPADWLAGEGIAVSGLRTPYGELDYRLRRDTDGSLRLSIGDGLRVPGGGVVVQPPGKWGGEVDVASGEATWTDGELRIDRLPAEVTLR